MARTDKHQFALYSKESLNDVVVGASFVISDEELVRRVCSILRLAARETLVLFNPHVVLTCTLTAINKKSFECTVTQREKVIPLDPIVVVVLPLLKREALEVAVYSCAAMGVNTIQLISTEKSASWGGAKELDRLQRVAIAACEQAKQFVVPSIKAPVALAEVAPLYDGISLKIHADVEGESFEQVMTIKLYGCAGYLLSVGPEGDLTQAERDVLRADGFTFCRLTPTVLKSEQALALLVGVVRAFSYQ